MKGEYYAVGRVRRAHGLRGELVIEALTDAPDAMFAAGRRLFAATRAGELLAEPHELRVIRSSPFKGGLIVAFEGIDDRTSAEGWRDRLFLVPAAEVSPPGEHELFIHDLVGMQVIRVSGEAVGSVTQVLEVPQGLLIDVQRGDGSSVLLPYDDHTVTDVDADRRVIRVDPVEGLLD